MRSPYRVAVVGPGGLGACAIREILRLPELELAGVLAFSASKNGVDAGTLVGGAAPAGVRVTTDFQEFLKCDAEVVLYTARDLGTWSSDDQILALLESGKDVITPLPYHYLKARGADVEARFRAAAEKGGATLHGSGITPGFFNERLMTLMTGLSNDIQSIRFQEFFNAAPLAGAVETLQLFGFGSSLEAAEKNVAVAMLAENYLRQPIVYYADRMGIEIGRIERKAQHRVAPKEIVTAATTIAKGTVGCVSYAWTGYAKGKPFYTTEVYWYLGDAMRPEAARGDDFWTITIEGRPSLQVTVASQASFARGLVVAPEEPSPAGYLMTIVALTQAIPLVVNAAPGLLPPAMPEVHWKPDLRA